MNWFTGNHFIHELGSIVNGEKVNINCLYFARQLFTKIAGAGIFPSSALNIGG